jgi:S-methylmethionine-dependent homocysteine/selenocysteine methylase
MSREGQLDMTEVTILDGATATELRRRGMAVRAPWWSSRALLTGPNRDVLQAVHESYLRAGADVLTADTFRCNRRALERMGLVDAGQGWMVHAAMGVAVAARHAAGGPGVRIAGSMAPVEDAYRPDLAPADEVLREEHTWLATELARAGVDLILVETANSVREARIATECAAAAGVEVWTGLAAVPGALLRNGEPVARAARAVADAGASAVLVNCTDVTTTQECLAELREAVDLPLGASPNVEDRRGITDGDDVDRVLPVAVDPVVLADRARRWCAEFGVAIIGGCCGTTPEHTAAMRDGDVLRAG